MANYQIVPLTSSTNFLPINIAAVSSSSPTAIHTADSTNVDELWLDAYNYTNDDVTLTLCIGSTSGFSQLSVPIPAGRGLIPVLRGNRFTGSVTISAFASITNSVSILGSVNRIVFT